MMRLGTTENMIRAVRDKIVIEKIQGIIHIGSKGSKIIGIQYGAEHMKKIGRYLIDGHGYKPTNGRFIKVFDIYEHQH